MRANLSDRITIIAIFSALLAWNFCLRIFWASAVDSSGSFATSQLAIGFLGFWFAFAKRNFFAKLACKLIKEFKLEKLIPLDKALSQELDYSPENQQKKSALLTAGAFFAVLAMLTCMVYIMLAGHLCETIGKNFHFGSFAWGVIERILLAIGSLISGIGALGVFFAASQIRRNTGRDIYACLMRDILWSICVGFGLLTLAYWLGYNLTNFAFLLAGVIITAAIYHSNKKKTQSIHRRKVKPIGKITSKQKIGLALSYFTIGLIFIIQIRLLNDTASASLTAKLFWLAFSMGLITFFVAMFDSQVRIIDRAQVGGLIIGIISCVFVQASEFYLQLADLGAFPRWIDWFGIWPAPAKFLICFAIATQIPLAAMIGMFLSQQRRAFASSAGSAGQYFSCAFAGLFHAVIISTIIGALGWGLSAWIIAASLAFLAAGAYTRKNIKRISLHTGWRLWSIVLLASLLWGIIDVSNQTHKNVGDIFAGNWLSTKVESNISDDKKTFSQHGLLGSGKTWRSDTITKCVAKILDAKRGKWWTICSDKADMPTDYPQPENLDAESLTRWSSKNIPAGLYFLGSHPEPPSAEKKYKKFHPPLSFTNSNFFKHAKQNLGASFYDGIYLAPMPADHPQAWRCYNMRNLKRAANRAVLYTYEKQPTGESHKKVSYGLVMLRTQVGANNCRKALSIARTFHKTVGPGYAIIALNDEGVDMLLVGPDKAFDISKDLSLLDMLQKFKKNRYDIYLLPITELWSSHQSVKPISITSPISQRLSNMPTLKSFKDSLEKSSKALRHSEYQKNK